MPDTKTSALTPLTAPQDPAKMYVPLYAQDGTPLNARMNVAEIVKIPKLIEIASGPLAGSSSPALSATQTWNDAGVTFTGMKLNITDTASNAASKLLDLQVGGSSKVNIRKDGMLKLARGTNQISIENEFSGYGIGFNSNGETAFLINSFARTIVGNNVQTAGYLGIGPTPDYSFVSDVQLNRDAADVLALRRANNNQLIRVYEDYTNSTDNFSRGVFGWKDADGTTDSTVLRIGTEKGSLGGTARAISFVTDGTERINVSGTANTVTLPSNSTLNLGSGGILRTQYINDASNTVTSFVLNSNGNAVFSDGSTTPRFQFAGTTSSFPSLKRSGTELQVRLADDSGFASFATGTLTIDEAKNVVLGTTTGTKIGTATGQKIGFWNATPVVQQILATGGGATVDNVITLLQTLGLCKQS